VDFDTPNLALASSCPSPNATLAALSRFAILDSSLSIFRRYANSLAALVRRTSDPGDDSQREQTNSVLA